MGDKAYKDLNAQQEQMKAVNNEIINMRLMHQTAKARAMMKQQTGRAIALPGVSGPEATESGFAAKKKELETLTQAHCTYLKSLM